MYNRPLRIVVTGGGSGGHITPLLAVAESLKRLRPDCQVMYIGQKGDGLADIPAKHAAIDAAYSVRAGKFRRYHGEGLKQLLDVPTMARNGRDIGYVAAGIVQSMRLLRRLRPDIVFIKGGFVGVPVGLAAAKLGIPFVTHDSDALPGLANRIISRWAAVHAVGLPKEVYDYPASKTVTVGVPIAAHFRRYSAHERSTLLRRLNLPDEAQVLMVSGGGLGARRVNDAVVANASSLLQAYPHLHILHQAGRGLQSEVEAAYDKALSVQDRARVTAYGFVEAMYELAAVANVVVTRAGATNMAEFAAMAKACIVIPNPLLTGGHQLKNAQAWQALEAAIVVDEPALLARPALLAEKLRNLLSDPASAERLAENLYKLAKPDAADQLAMVLLEVVEKNQPAADIPTGQTPKP